MNRTTGFLLLFILSLGWVKAQKTDPYHNYKGGYGELIARMDRLSVWWCEGAYKVMPDTPVPKRKTKSIDLMAARNEYEPLQLVINPKDTIKKLMVSVDRLTGPYGEISGDNIEIRQVEYVTVSKPTDSYAYSGLWPDPLPLLDDSIVVYPGQNTVIWISLYIPPGSQPGIYRTTASISGENLSVEIPLNISVKSFILPETASIRSGFGLSVDKIAAYHNISNREDLEKTFDFYMQAFRDYKISPYNFYYLDPVRMSTEGLSWEEGYYDSENAFAGEYSLRLEDNSCNSDPGAHYRELVPVDNETIYTLSWQSRATDSSQQYTVLVQGYDSNDQGLMYESRAEAFNSNTGWEKGSYRFGSFGDKVSKVRLSLFPVFRTAEGKNTGKIWFDNLVLTEAGRKLNLLKGGDFEIEADSINIILDFNDFDRAASRYLDNFGFNGFRLYLEGMGRGSYYSRTEGTFQGFDAGTDEYTKLMSQYLKQVQDHLEEKGWLGKEYIYWFDEPGKQDYPFVREGMELIKRAAPRLTTFLTENDPGPDIYDVTDISCTILHSIERDRVKKVKDKGGEYWSYICTGPRAPWISEFIDHDAINLRMWLWMSYAYSLDGILIWSTNYWTSYSATPPDFLQNPWTEAASYVQGYGWPLGKQTNWGNGDGRFFYPPNRNPGVDKTTYIEGPIPSIRLEFLRQGIEDYEYFVLLEQLLEKHGSELPPGMLRKARKLQEIPAEIFVDGRNYTKNPDLLYKHRQKLADQIEEIQHLVK